MKPEEREKKFLRDYLELFLSKGNDIRQFQQTAEKLFVKTKQISSHVFKQFINEIVLREEIAEKEADIKALEHQVTVLKDEIKKLKNNINPPVTRTIIQDPCSRGPSRISGC